MRLLHLETPFQHLEYYPGDLPQIISIASYDFTSMGLKFSSLNFARHSHIISYPILCHLYVESMYKTLIAMMAYRSSCVIGLVHGCKLIILQILTVTALLEYFDLFADRAI